VRREKYKMIRGRGTAQVLEKNKKSDPREGHEGIKDIGFRSTGETTKKNEGTATFVSTWGSAYLTNRRNGKNKGKWIEGRAYGGRGVHGPRLGEA